ncbi:MAG: DUF5333 domain-containing protein [Pseudomonadota bacterium]
MDPWTRLVLTATAATMMALLTTVGASRADEYDALRNDPEVENGVLIVAIGDLIRDNCPSIEDRRARSIPFLIGLVNRAQSLGYSRSEIEDYIDDDAEQARVMARAQTWLVQEGADLAAPETICTVARDEISAQSVIGRLIRER